MLNLLNITMHTRCVKLHMPFMEGWCPGLTALELLVFDDGSAHLQFGVDYPEDLLMMAYEISLDGEVSCLGDVA